MNGGPGSGPAHRPGERSAGRARRSARGAFSVGAWENCPNSKLYAGRYQFVLGVCPGRKRFVDIGHVPLASTIDQAMGCAGYALPDLGGRSGDGSREIGAELAAAEIADGICLGVIICRFRVAAGRLIGALPRQIGLLPDG